MSRLTAVIALAVMMVSLSGCYESRNTQRYEPGVYKGSYDPLLPKQKRERVQAGLVDRANDAYWDR